MTNPNEKIEIIEQALQESVGGAVGWRDFCTFTCTIFSVNVCYVELCHMPTSDPF